MPVLPQVGTLPSNGGTAENWLYQSTPYHECVMSESLMSGLREDGKMSLIRSFYCLFVIFDLLFTILLWFISVVVHGGSVYQSLLNEVCGYSIQTSLFDVVGAVMSGTVVTVFCYICALCTEESFNFIYSFVFATLRFIVLLLYYGLLYRSRLYAAFVTTSGTSAFLLCKVFFYNWTSSSQPLLQAIIIMSSFVISWIEVWFIGLRVIPQEQCAKKYLTINGRATERTPLLSSQSSVVASDSSSQLFYSPVVTPEGSVNGENEEDMLNRTPQDTKEYYMSTTTEYQHTTNSISTTSTDNYTSINNSSETSTANNTGTMEIDYVQKGREILDAATETLSTGEWVFERRTEDGDSLFSRQLDNRDIVYRLTAVIDLPAHDLMVILYHDLEAYPKWNPTLLECRVIQKIDETTDISYQVTAPGARGCVASRDFITLRHWKMKDDTYIAASASIDYPGVPAKSDYIRGHSGPGCWELRPLSSSPEKTEYRWLLNTKLNGWIPLYIADKAFKKFMAKYMIFLRAYCEKVKAHTMLNTTDFPASQNITS